MAAVCQLPQTARAGEPSRISRGCRTDPRASVSRDGMDLMTTTALPRVVLMLLGAMIVLSGCARPEAHPVATAPAPAPANTAAQTCQTETVQEGKASWYGSYHQGEKTASGERFDANARTAAHPSLPLGTPIEVTNLENGRKTSLVVNDRGPHKKGRVLDVSKKGAQDLGFVTDGVAPVRIEAARGDCAGAVQASSANE